MTRICKKIMNVGPDIGEAQAADSRLCKALISIGPRIGDSGTTVVYPGTGETVYPGSGTIIYP